MELKVRGRDGAGRLLEVKLNSGRKMITPTFFPVYNPHLPLITPEEIRKEFHWNEIITNAYIIWRDSRLSREAEEKGIHGLLNFDGVVMMDSGAYQMWMYGKLEVTNEEIIEFQNKIRPDIGTFHDTIVPPEASYEEAAEAVKNTLINAEVCAELGSEEVSWMATVQGSVHLDIVKTAAESLRSLSFPYYAVGGLAPGAMRWKFKPYIGFIVTALSILPRSRPVHGWGIGHPAAFSLLVLLGIDTFDSASYALYAKDDRVMFPWGTERLQDLEELPYSPFLKGYTAKELLEMEKSDRIRIIARHNLWMMIEEIRAIREALRGEYLFEYVQERVRSHPGLYEAYRYLLEKNWRFLEEFTPFSKKHGLFVVGEEFRFRPEARRALERLESLKNRETIEHPIYGNLPKTLYFTYPFGQTVFSTSEEEILPRFDPVDQARDIIAYQWGVELEREKMKVEARKGRARKVYYEGTFIGSVRPNDGLFLPSIEGAKLLKERLPFPKGRIVVDDVARGPVSEGKSVFTKFVLDVDPDLRPNQEVIVVDAEDTVLAVGKLVLSPREIEEFESHVAVKVRHGSARS